MNRNSGGRWRASLRGRKLSSLGSGSVVALLHWLDGLLVGLLVLLLVGLLVWLLVLLLRSVLGLTGAKWLWAGRVRRRAGASRCGCAGSTIFHLHGRRRSGGDRRLGDLRTRFAGGLSISDVGGCGELRSTRCWGFVLLVAAEEEDDGTDNEAENGNTANDTTNDGADWSGAAAWCRGG